MRHCRSSFIQIFVCCLGLVVSHALNAAPFLSDWRGNRTWIGPAYWANPLQDWQVKGEQVRGLAGHDRTLHLLSHQVSRVRGDLEMTVQLRLSGDIEKGKNFLGGFRFGIRGELDDYRHALIQGIEWIDAGIRGDGTVILAGVESEGKLMGSGWVRLKLTARMNDSDTTVRLLAENVEDSKNTVSLAVTVLSETLRGNIALLANGPKGNPDRLVGPFWEFRDWSVRGSAVIEDGNRVFGPILWSQYTLSKRILKLQAQMAPVEGSEELVRLQIARGEEWKEIAAVSVDPLSRTALFRVENWDDSADVPYRVVYRWEGGDHFWTGTIRKDPRDQDTVTVAAFSCDNGYLFPNSRITRNVDIQDPDLLFFAGDQIYEGFGGFGRTRKPLDLAMLNYLRKYWQFGWSWRELLKDRPSVIIPDDHDVFQGNIWGHGGRRIPGYDLSDPLTASDQSRGGYAMEPDWVNAVQRTQCGSLPDPVDPDPVAQGIEVYFTSMHYGGIDFAILEDRKFKTGPASLADPGKPNGAELLGPRQEAFLKKWISNSSAQFRVALSQTIFCKVTTHAGRRLNSTDGGTDSNGWPPQKRDLALGILGPEVVMVHGDQHIGALVRQGTNHWEDGPVAFMVPGIANGFPRAWWPDEPGDDQVAGDPHGTGRYFDSLGNRMTVLAVANPEKGSNMITRGAQDPESIGHQKGSGHGLLSFRRKTGEVTFEIWRLKFDAANPKREDQFPGFPKTLKVVNR